MAECVAELSKRVKHNKQAAAGCIIHGGSPRFNEFNAFCTMGG